MTRSYPIFSRFLLFIILPLLIGISFLYLDLRASNSPASGAFQLSGINAQIEIVHDQYGVPYIEAKNDHDAFFALGYKHASDRLWQLEIQRRLVQGRLSEILGSETLQSDIWMRTLGLNHAARESAKHLDNQSIDILNAYSDGINAWIQQNKVLPIEFKIFGFKPEPWTIYDSLGWQKYFSFELNGNMFDELRRYVLQQHFSPQQISYFYPHDPIMPYSTLVDNHQLNLIANNKTMIKFGAGYKFAGSNAWVVSGKYTKSGFPIIANDPHLALQLPALWYAVKIKGHKLDASGMTLVGVPAVIFGQNTNIAWGGTNLMSDQQDLFIETTSPDHPNQYFTGNEWKPFMERRENINVKAQFPSVIRKPLKPVSIIVRQSDRGPIISDTQLVDDSVISLRWAALDAEDRTIDSFIKLQYASNWEEFRNSLSTLKAPGLNFVYADRQGNIGYQTAGMMPKRNSGIGILPQLGTENNDWQGYYDFELMPSILNPKTGFVVTANEKINHDENIIISHEWAPSARHDRIIQLLTSHIASNKLLTVEDMGSIQQDRKDLTSNELLTYFKNFKSDSSAENKVVEILAKWDGEFNADSIGATLYATWSYYLTNEIFDEVLKHSWQRHNLEEMLSSTVDELTWTQLSKVLASNQHDWCKQDQSEPCQDELKQSLGKAIRNLEKITSTADISEWQWENVHSTEFRHHPFGRVKGLEDLFTRVTHSGGSPNSVNAANIEFDAMTGFTQTFGAGFRQVFELDGNNSHWYMISTGQSGNIMSSHFDDMVKPFLNGQLVQVSVSSQTKNIIKLYPVMGQ